MPGALDGKVALVTGAPLARKTAQTPNLLTNR
jgi:hypothetical protein